MKKIILSLIAVMACMSINAQVVKVYKNGNLEKTYTNTATDKYKVVFEEASAAPSNLLPGKFSVSDTKQVQFTKSNLYWDGSAWHFEANQTDYDKGTTSEETTTYTSTHVSHLFWSKDASVMYAASYSDESKDTDDAFFFCEANKDKDANKVDGANGYYLLTSDEWNYLFDTRTNANKLYMLGVTVTNDGTDYANCLIIAPDDFKETLQSSYTLDEVNAAGLVCLPVAGYRIGSEILEGGSYGSYCSATPYPGYAGKAYYLDFNSSDVTPASNDDRNFGCSVRLVK